MHREPPRRNKRASREAPVLHAGLLLRIAGDLLVWEPGRSWGGLVDALAIGW